MTAKLTPRETRQKLDADVAKAQRDVLAPGKAESQAQRDRRVAADRARVEQLHADVAQAQVDEGNRARIALESQTPAERAEARKAAEAAVLERHKAVEAAVAAENERLAARE